MKILLIFIGFLFVFNSYAEPKNPLKEKLYGTWSIDCEQPKSLRYVRSSSLVIRDDKLEVKNAEGKVVAIGTYKIESITPNKFRIQYSNKSTLNQDGTTTGTFVGEFPENGTFNKYSTLSSTGVNQKGETFSLQRRGGLAFMKSYADAEEKVFNGVLTMERCLN